MSSHIRLVPHSTSMHSNEHDCRLTHASMHAQRDYTSKEGSPETASDEPYEMTFCTR